ncbi:peptidylprolyl isomerase [Novosphingobium terrae]|uniref:peptidylprolyl isomerase n=1 Tax=Novosphingobium terrae TaxID=2726189 RepID=UPI001F12BF61|nr:peptidylprolyl isomerase [Novosphingobium terrae]
MALASFSYYSSAMLKRIALLALILATPLTAAPVRHAPAQAAQPKYAPPPAIQLQDVEHVVITTDQGEIVLELDGKHAPITTLNFLRYAQSKRFDGILFYRAMHLPWGTPPSGLIQAGTQGDPRRLLPPIAHEPTTVTGVHHKAGAISMARYAPGTATGDFSILLSDIDGLDANPKADSEDDRQGYAAFGHVVKGMDVARRIFDAPLDPEKGEGVMKGQMLAQPVKVITVRRWEGAWPDQAPAAGAAPSAP